MKRVRCANDIIITFLLFFKFKYKTYFFVLFLVSLLSLSHTCALFTFFFFFFLFSLSLCIFLSTFRTNKLIFLFPSSLAGCLPHSHSSSPVSLPISSIFLLSYSFIFFLIFFIFFLFFFLFFFFLLHTKYTLIHIARK